MTWSVPMSWPPRTVVSRWSWESHPRVPDSHVGATTTTDIQRSFRWLVGGWLEPFFFTTKSPPNLRCILGGGFKTFQIFIPIWGIAPN